MVTLGIRNNILFLVVSLLAQHIALADDESDGRVCSVNEPTSSQVCVAIKFPWKEEPVYFCTDQENLNYNPQCTDPEQSRHCHDDARNDTLKIATPWDCCPIISTPNKCSNVECPSEPFNRTCKITKILGDCCPTYFCDRGEPDNCKTSRLRTSCMNPPANKFNCTAFRDPYGCCNNYQCAGEEKVGICPRQFRQNQEVVQPTGFFEKMYQDAKKTVNKITVGVKETLEKHGGDIGRSISNVIPVPFKTKKSMPMFPRCSGDYTCPGTMKCCRPLHHYSVSHHTIYRRKADGQMQTTNLRVFKSEGYPNQVIDGVCMEPDPEGARYDSTTTRISTDDNDKSSTSSSNYIQSDPLAPAEPSRDGDAYAATSIPRGRQARPQDDYVSEEPNSYVHE